MPGAPPQLVEVADRVYAYIQPDGSWWLNNTGLIVGDTGVVSIDTCATESRTLRYLDSVAELAGLPVTTVVNTHHHGDHTHGNYLTAPATIIGHRRCRDELIHSSPGVDDPLRPAIEWGHLQLAPPTIVFADSMAIFVDDRTVELRHPGDEAHTNNDVVVWLPAERVLFTGDLAFNGGTPFALMGSISGWRRALGWLRSFGAETVVPGHGPICGPEVFDEIDAYLEFIEDRGAAAWRAGVSPLEAARSIDLERFSHLLDSERLVGNLHRLYAELDQLTGPSDIDVVEALRDMVSFNGGQPLRSFA